MNRVFSMTLAAAVFSAGAFAQTPTPTPTPKPQEGDKPAATQTTKEKVTVVFLGNETCPVDAKAIDRDKWAEIDGQRIFVCSDGCIATVKKDAKAMLAKAYPSARPLDAKECGCGMAVDAAKATPITWQGYKVALCGDACVTEFKKSPVTMIALMTHPDAKDAKNTADPIDGKPIDPWVVVLYKNHLIHLGKFSNIAAFEKDPAAVAAKLKLSG